MRHFIFATFLLAACTARPVSSPSDVPVQFLIDASAGDFHAHPPVPVRFRDVRVAHLTGSDGVTRYMLCGQFMPRADAQWMPFATIKTSPYEQWLGNQAASYCSQSGLVWDKADDLSSSLQSRLESMR